MIDPPGQADRELEAIGTILRALQPLEGDSVQRVLDYIFRRLSINWPSGISSQGSIEMASPPVPGAKEGGRPRQPSIRDLKEEKRPESDNQMAALVAYYFSEEAPEDERKPAVGKADIEKLFKQAGFKLPKRPSMTLPNAAAAGYLDSIGGGLYKLNPVGYNLVVHALPRDQFFASSPPRPRKKPSRR